MIKLQLSDEEAKVTIMALGAFARTSTEFLTDVSDTPSVRNDGYKEDLVTKVTSRRAHALAVLNRLEDLHWTKI